MRPELLLARHLAAGDLVEKPDRAVGLLRERELELLYVGVQGVGVIDELGGQCLALGLVVGLEPGFGLGGPEILLDGVPAGPVLALLEVRLAQVHARVEVAERFGHGLDALPEDPGRRVLGARGVIIAGDVRGGKGLGSRDEVLDLVLDVGLVVGVGGVDLGAEVVTEREGGSRVGDREGRLADARADHSGLADGEVVPGTGLHHEGARDAGTDVLGLADDAQTVVAQQVELGHLVAGVRHDERDGAARSLGCRHGAGVGARVHCQLGRPGGGCRVRHASGERDQRGKTQRGETHGGGGRTGDHQAPAVSGVGATGTEGRWRDLRMKIVMTGTT